MAELLQPRQQAGSRHRQKKQAGFEERAAHQAWPDAKLVGLPPLRQARPEARHPRRVGVKLARKICGEERFLVPRHNLEDGERASRKQDGDEDAAGLRADAGGADRAEER